MLDKNDLQSIREIVAEEVGVVKQKLFAIEKEIQFIKEKIGKISLAGSEDIVALSKDIEEIKKKQVDLEEQIGKLQAQSV